ncbi:hypothetical protein WJ968_04885 [Achromobacter xylosoxidans]
MNRLHGQASHRPQILTVYAHERARWHADLVGANLVPARACTLVTVAGEHRQLAIAGLAHKVAGGVSAQADAGGVRCAADFPAQLVDAGVGDIAAPGCEVFAIGVGDAAKEAPALDQRLPAGLLDSAAGLPSSAVRTALVLKA